MQKTASKAAKDFKVSFFADEVHLLSLLGIWFLVFCVSLIGIWGFGLVYLNTSLGVIVLGLSSAIAVLSVQMISYLLVMCLRSGAVFSLDKRGLRDHASFCQAGYVLIKDIKSIFIQETIAGNYILVKLNPGSLALQRLGFFQRCLSWLPRRFASDTLSIPMGVVDASRMNIDTQFSHFLNLLRESQQAQTKVNAGALNLSGSRFEGHMNSETPPSSKLSTTETSDEARATAEKTPLSRLKNEPPKDVSATDIEISNVNVPPPLTPDPEPFDEQGSGVYSATLVLQEGQEGLEHTFVPPQVDDPNKSEKSVVIEQIQALKEYVTQRDIDRKLCEGYGDYIVNFPRWSVNQDPRVPQSVAEVRTISSGSEYEEVAFYYKGYPFHFSLRRDIGPSDLALLSLSFQGTVRVSLRVIVHIGSLEPERIEVYHRGQWEKLFLELFTEMTGEADIDGSTAFVEATELDISVLKKNFGFKSNTDQE